LEPTLAGERLLRVPGPGRLDRLDAVHVLRKRDSLAQPPKGREVPYGPVSGALRQGPHGAARVLSFEGARFGLEETAWVTQRYRAALLAHLGDAPAILTGHDPAGGPARRAHVAFAPLAYVDREHADGTIKGMAVVIPRDADEEALTRLDDAIQRVTRLVFGGRGEINLRLVPSEGDDAMTDSGLPESLRFSRYSGSRTTWASVTPVALGRHPKPRKGLSEEQVLAADLADLGLPVPAGLRLHDVATVRGAPPARACRPGDLSALRNRLLRHVRVTFSEPVRGPLLVGAGRYMGFGLLLPVRAQ
jgi:CRISPR-associated protein Csb2